MFEFLVGWRKASKCKKLIRRVQRRLKLLKNKRSAIARQLRDDLAELLKHGHGRTAFDRAEQLYKDECLLAAYDLLDKFCEFIISNLHYIRRNKYCPNDINEAVSSLIFASARFGDLPELISIRKLFGDRYGQRFAMVALELLPGNLVNRQMQEKMCIKSVSDDEKSRLVEEILKSSLQSGPLLLEYSSELQQNLENKWIGDPIPGTEANNEPDDGDNLQVFNVSEEETKFVPVDFLTENKNLRSLCRSSLISSSTLPSTHSVIVEQTPLDTVASTEKKRNQGLMISDQKMSPCAIDVSDLQQLERSLVVYDPALKRDEESAIAESSSESSREIPEQMIYLDDIQEFESPQGKESNLQDQRLFKFRSSVVPIRGKLYKSKDEGFDQELEDFQDQKSASRSIRKNRNASTTRLRRRSVSGGATSMNDKECAIYYGESSYISPNYDQKCHDRQRHHKKIPIKQQPKTYYVQEIVSNDSSFIKVKSSFRCTRHSDYQTRSSSKKKTVHACSLEHPCYTCTNDEKHELDYTPHKAIIQLELPQCCCSCSKNQEVLKAERATFVNQKVKNYEEATSPALLVSTCSGSSSSSASIEEKPSYMRAMTMPLERAKDATIDSMLRLNSFPLQEHESSLNRHVHPNLPDYDELAAKFIALKKATLQREKHQPAQMSKKHSSAVSF